MYVNQTIQLEDRILLDIWYKDHSISYSKSFSEAVEAEYVTTTKLFQ